MFFVQLRIARLHRPRRPGHQVEPRGAEGKTEAAPAEGEDAAPAEPARKTKPKAPSGKLKAVLYFPPREGADGNPDAFDADWPVLGPCPVGGLPVQHTPTAGYRVCPHKAQEAGAEKDLQPQRRDAQVPAVAGRRPPACSMKARPA
jgi:hypothetical protein